MMKKHYPMLWNKKGGMAVKKLSSVILIIFVCFSLYAGCTESGPAIGEEDDAEVVFRNDLFKDRPWRDVNR